MRLAIDARELSGHPTGVGRYLSELLTAWHTSGADQRHEVTLYSHRAPALPAGLRAEVQVLTGRGGTRWEQWDLARALGRTRPDVFFAPGYTAPLAAAAPTVVALHDVSFFAHPEWFSTREGTRRRLITAWSARRARLVLAPSAFSAAEIVRHTAVERGRVRVVYLGVRAAVTPATAGHRAPVVLFVGSLFQRRRLDVLIDAFAAVARTHPSARLEIVGANRTSPPVDFAAALTMRGLDGQARLRDWIDDAALAGLYRDATVFVFLSRYEGFGFTPLEALAHGVVPVVLDTPVAREIYGEAAWRVADDAAVTDHVATAIRTLLDEPATRARFTAAAVPVLAGYQWADTARRTLACLEEAAGG